MYVWTIYVNDATVNCINLHSKFYKLQLLITIYVDWFLISYYIMLHNNYLAVCVNTSIYRH